MFGETGFTFGDDSFGKIDALKEMIFKSLPYLHQIEDEAEGSPLRRLLKSLEDELAQIEGRIGQLVYQRDPYHVFAGETYPICRIVSAQDNGDGTTTFSLDTEHNVTASQTVQVSGASSIAPLINRELQVLETPTATSLKVEGTAGNVGQGAYLTRASDRSILCEAIDWVEDTSNDFGKMGALVKITFGDNPSTLRGLGIGYSSQVITASADSIALEVVRIRRRDSVEILCKSSRLLNDVSLPSVLVFKRPSFIETLAQDFGVVFDKNDLPRFKRSTVANVVKYIEKKGSEKAYQIRAETKGLNVDVKGLYRVNTPFEGLPSSKIYAIDQNYYVSERPRSFYFDDIPADSEGIDSDGISFPLLDEFIYNDDSRDNISRAKHYSQCIFNVEVISDREASNSELNEHSLGYGRVVEIIANPLDLERVSQFERGAFALQGNEELYIEGIVSPFTALNGTQSIAQLIIGHPNEVSVGNYCLVYTADMKDTWCGLCPTHRVAIEVEALEESKLIGEPLNRAFDRMLSIFSNELKPIHVNFDIATLVKNVNVEVPIPSVSLSTEDSIEIDIPFTNLYDVQSADTASTDEGTVEVSVSVIIT